MGIERKLRYTLIVTSVWFEDAQKKGNDIEKKRLMSQALSVADDKGNITEDKAPGWLKKMRFGTRETPQFPVRITDVHYQGNFYNDTVEITHFEALSWDEYSSLGRKNEITLQPTYTLA